MGLVTRTLCVAFSDLFHFALLYFWILISYAYVGYFIFGHQFSAMSTFDKSMGVLFIIMMNFDPEQFWQQLLGAANELTLHIYLWTYIVITFFILLNMFLAIIVDSYAVVKAESGS